MAASAYIMIETIVSKLGDVARQLQVMPGVESIDLVTGPYDIIAVVTAADLNAVGDLVTGEIHAVDGIVCTVTCLSVGGP